MLTTAMIETLRREYGKIETMDPCGDAYPKLVKLLDSLPPEALRALASAKIKWVSSLARNRVK